MHEITDEADVTANGLRLGSHPGQTDRPSEAQIATCMRFLAQRMETQKNFNPKRGSYGLKHEVERWTERPTGGHSSREYISNGAFIVAALRAGYRVKPDSDRSLNATFNMREKQLAVWPWATRAPFSAWLLAQRGREDPVGDLAVDASRDAAWPAGATSLDQVLQYLQRQPAAVPECLDAARAAWATFTARHQAVEKPARRYRHNALLQGQPFQMRAARMDAAHAAARKAQLDCHSLAKERQRGGRGPSQEEVRSAQIAAAAHAYSRWWPEPLALALAQADFGPAA